MTSASADSDGTVISPWRALLDGEGAVAEHRMTLRRSGVDTVVRTGRRGFATAVSTGRVLVGERSATGTSLVMVDIERTCRLWQRSIDRLAYDVTVPSGGMEIRLATHDPSTRRYEGTLVIDAQTGSTNAMIDGDCGAACEPNDGEVPPAAFGPAGAARPVPSFAAGGWARDKTLTFRWRASNVPPAWARPALKNAAADATRTRISRSPTFLYRSGASNSVRYTSLFPTFCRYGIACASRAMPAWAVWIRPYGTDLSWGTLRWCQKKNSSGCFDVRRVMLHELGHITGLQHPSAAGFRLAPHETVMHAISPARPAPGSSRHAFGRCDVATLQELYDVPSRKSLISRCNDVRTTLVLSASRTSLAAGGSVDLLAQLRILDRPDYGLLRRNGLNGRSVKLKYRRAGSSDAWTTAWMKPLSAAGRYRTTISPLATWEFKAVFQAPSNEGLRYSRSTILKVKVKN
ncbi:MAG: hypothetical protein ACC726_00020 [Chloroflexota bacterium]